MEELSLTQLRDKCLNSLYTCTKNVSKYLVDDERGVEFNKMRNCVKEYCKMEQQEQAGMKAVRSFETESDFPDWPSLKIQFENKLAQHSKKHAKFDNHPSMKEFERSVKRAEQLREQTLGTDVAITETINTYIDPFTRKQITNPVRNIICTHVYDKKTADNIIRQRNNKGCPYLGCDNRQPMQAEHLEADQELQSTIQRTQQTSQIYDDDD